MVRVGIYGEYDVGFDTSYLRTCSLHLRVCKWERKSLWFMVNTAQDLIRRTYALAAYTVASASGGINRQKARQCQHKSGSKSEHTASFV